MTDRLPCSASPTTASQSTLPDARFSSFLQLPSQETPVGFNMSKIRCRVHPSVVLTMLDAHSRLRDSADFAIGTLLGYVSTDASGSIVDVLDCFANPYHWDCTSSALTIQKETHEWMLKLKEKINPKLGVVGWCCTTEIMLYTTALSDWARDEQKVSRFHPSKTLPEPLHILINPRFDMELSLMSQVKAYVRGSLRQLFHRVPLEISISTVDPEGISAIIKSSSAVSPTPVLLEETGPSLHASSSSLIASLRKLQSFIALCLDYIERVLEDKAVADTEIGRKLMSTVCVETLLPQNEIESMSERALQDNLMIAYLTNLARLQFVIAEKLNTSFN